MSIRVGALREEITVYLRIQSGTDRYGDPIYADSPGTLVPAAVAGLGAGVGAQNEELTNRDTRIVRYRVTVAPEVVLDGLSRIVWRGESFEVVGEPQVFSRLGTVHHQEFDIRRFEG